MTTNPQTKNYAPEDRWTVRRGDNARDIRLAIAEHSRRHRIIFRQPRGPLAAMTFGRTR